jgi:hypothetical protein
MQAIDLTSRRQRYAVLALTVVYPAIWLIGLLSTLSGGAFPKFAALPAFPVYLASAAGALASVLRARSGRRASWIQRYAIYLMLGWLVPLCMLAAQAVSGFISLWPALAILTLPGAAFLFLRAGREHFLLFAVGCIALAGLALFVTSETPASFKARLLIPLVFTAGPFWSLAAYATLYEHVLSDRRIEPGGARETAIACTVTLVGIAIFFGLIYGLILLSMSGIR